MKTLAYVLVACLSVVNIVQAQQPAPPKDKTLNLQEGESQEVVPGVTITLEPDLAGATFVPTDSVAVSPVAPQLILKRGETFGTLFFTVSSPDADTEIRAEASQPDLLKPTEQEEWIPLLQGATRSLNFTAYATHEGTIRFFNRNNQVVAMIAYRVINENPLKNRIGGRLSTSTSLIEGTFDNSFGVDYSISNVYDGWSGTVGVGYNPDDQELSGGVSASYSW